VKVVSVGEKRPITMAPIRPFKIDVPQADLDRLHQKLELTRLPGDVDDAGKDYGAPL
jgi:hypothetical protein